MRESWGVRELRKNIERKVFERKTLAALQLHQVSDSTNVVFKDPYFLDYLELKEGYLEKFTAVEARYYANFKSESFAIDYL